jgi:glycerophosphoryl diester phosphodiesterase
LGQLALAQEPGPLVMAHRGGGHEFEENTMHAFRTCYEKGIRGFETDIRITKYNVPVILHDDSLDRTHNGAGPIEHKTAAELKDLVTKKTGEKFLFAEDFLSYFRSKLLSLTISKPTAAASMARTAIGRARARAAPFRSSRLSDARARQFQ